MANTETKLISWNLNKLLFFYQWVLGNTHVNSNTCRDASAGIPAEAAKACKSLNLFKTLINLQCLDCCMPHG